jgi:hypothetical protein
MVGRQDKPRRLQMFRLAVPQHDSPKRKTPTNQAACVARAAAITSE